MTKNSVPSHLSGHKPFLGLPMVILTISFSTDGLLPFGYPLTKRTWVYGFNIILCVLIYSLSKSVLPAKHEAKSFTSTILLLFWKNRTTQYGLIIRYSSVFSPATIRSYHCLQTLRVNVFFSIFTPPPSLLQVYPQRAFFLP